MLSGRAPGFVIHEDGTVRFYNWVCVPAMEELKNNFFYEGHHISHSVHPVGNKLYKDLKQTFWWSNIK